MINEEKGSKNKGVRNSKGSVTERGKNVSLHVGENKKTTLPKVESAHKVIKQGYMSKKTDGFFFNWAVFSILSRNAISC